MTATVTTTYTRTPIADVLSVESVKGLSDADLKKTHGMIWAPGQLWERVAELSATGLNYTERMERVKIARIAKAQGIHTEEPTRTWGFSLISGPSLVTFSNPTVSGIIRAGERIK